ncbi:MAG: transposase, partial [Thermotogae bacterium]
MKLTRQIELKKKSVIHKLERTTRYWQQFKNLIYLIALEYYENNRDISVFTNQSVLDKIVKGKIRPEFANEKIYVFVNQLVDLSTNILGADTVKAILRKVTHEYRATLKAWHKKQKHSLPKPVKLSKMTSFTFNTNPNMVIDKRYLKTKKQNAIVVRLAKSTAVKIKITKNLECDYISLVWNKDTPAKALLM